LDLFLISQVIGWNHYSFGQKKNPSVLIEVDIYPLINNPYELSKHPKVENVLKFNLTKISSEKPDFTQSNKILKP
jgi:hypothetical protein